MLRAFTTGLVAAAASASLSGEAHADPAPKTNILEHTVDHYNGINIMGVPTESTDAMFGEKLGSSLKSWRQEGRRGVWLRLKSPHQMHLLNTAVNDHGFQVHSATPEEVLLSHWLPGDSPSSLPHGPSYYLGVGVICVSKSGKILAVQEKNGWLKGKGWWKMVTGLADPLEPIEKAALRELKEETGVTGKFDRILAIRQGRGTLGKGDIFVVCLVEPLDEELTPQETEIEKAAWVDMDDFFNQKWLSGRPSYKKLNDAIYLTIKGGNKNKAITGLLSESFEKDRMTIYYPPTMEEPEV